MAHSSLNYSWTILLSVVIVVSCGQATNTNPPDKKEIVATVHPVDTSLIAIIPFNKSSEWLFDKTYTPSTLIQSDIEKIESLLVTCVTDYNNKLSADSKQYFAIDLTKEKYKRQYVVVINNKADKEVWMNCLCQTHGDNWKTSIILVEDGGNCFFNLKINLSKEMCYDLFVNGLA